MVLAAEEKVWQMTILNFFSSIVKIYQLTGYAMINRQINGNEILPKKEGTRTLVYPACGIDNHWIEFLNPDIFIGIDLMKSDSNPFYIRGLKTKSIFYSGRDAIVPLEIPKADETVLLLKCFDWIRLPDCCWKAIGHHDSWLDLNQELWERYQKENLTSLKEYLEKCEENASKRTFVIDFDGYEKVISQKGYRKVLSLTPTIDCCNDRCEFRDSKQCEKSMPLFNWPEVEKMRGYGCRTAERTKIVADVDYYFEYPTVPILATYLKEK